MCLEPLDSAAIRRDGDLFVQEVDGLSVRLREPFSLGFLRKLGTVFRVFDDQDSGNLCFGTEKEGARYFVKLAGAPTARGSTSPGQAVKRLQAAVPVYRDLRHENLIDLVWAGELGGGYAAVFRWADGDCMGRMWGSSLFQSPEEYRLGAAIDELTNVYTAGAFAFALFGGYQRERESWELSDGLYHVAFRAVNADRARRQPSLRALREEWETALAYRAK